MGNLGWTTLCLGGYRPETMLVTWLLTGVTLAVSCARGFSSGTHLSSRLNPAWSLLPFLTYAALNIVFVTPVPWLGWLDWLGWANLVATFFVAAGLRAPATRRAVFFAMVLLAIVAVALACYQRFVRPDWLMLGRTQAAQFVGRATGPFGIPNSLAALLLLLLPACGALTFRQGATAVARIWWGWVTVIVTLGVGLTISRGAWIGLALALAIWPLLRGGWNWRRRLKMSLSLLFACGGVAAVAVTASPAIRDRFVLLGREAGELSRPVLWRAAVKLWQESPFTGTGAGSYNSAFERHRPARFLDEPQWAHNDYLNTLSDYGLAGFVLFFGAAAWIGWTTNRRRREPDPSVLNGERIESGEIRGALAVGLLAFALQLFVDFHFKIPALAMAFSVCAALALPRPLVRPVPPAASMRRRRWAHAVALAALVATFWSGFTLLRAEAWRYGARQSMDRIAWDEKTGKDVVLARAVTDLQRAVEVCPSHAGAWSGLSFARQLEAWVMPARTMALAKPAEDAARRALERSAAVPEFWLRLGVSLDMQGRFPEAQVAFGRALALAPNRVQGWYYFAYHLSLEPARAAEARKAVTTCLALDPGNGAALALLRRLNDRP
jgi:O-antigen ligase